MEMADKTNAEHMTVWAEDMGVTWDTASDDIKEKFALQRLFWFFRMMTFEKTPMLSDELDREVFDQAKEAAEWFGPIFRALAESPGLST